MKEKIYDPPPLVLNERHFIKDTDAVMSKTLHTIWKQLTDQTDKKKDKKALA